MKFLDCVKERYSCREFLPYTITKAELDEILEAGILSPSSLGLEPWKFYVVQDEKRKAEIAEIANKQEHVKTCSVIIIIAARLDFDKYFIKKLESRNLKGAELEKRVALYKPYIDALSGDRKLYYAREQTHLALMNLANAATDLGLDSCIIGGFDNEKLDSYLNLGESEKSSIMLVIGKGANAKELRKQQKIRSKKDEVICYLS